MNKLLWIGDAVVPTGLARVAHNVLAQLQKHEWEVAVVGVGYDGDPHPYSYPIYPARISAYDDMFGRKRLPKILSAFQPDIVVINNDPWNIANFVGKFDVPMVAYMPVDGPNIRSDIAKKLNGLSACIAYTQFGAKELTRAGLGEPAMFVVPHGVDSELYRPIDKHHARHMLGLDMLPKDSFVVGNVNRNQPRKRLDLTIMIFAKWLKSIGYPKAVYLHLHCGLRDVGWDLLQLASYYGVQDRVIITDPRMENELGLPENVMPYVYNSFDVQITTTMGEGWGLTTHEGMACGIPQIVPDWSALREWPEDSVIKVPIASEQATSGMINTIGGVVDELRFIECLNDVHSHEFLRSELGRKVLERATSPEFRWERIGDKFHEILSLVLLTTKGSALIPDFRCPTDSSGALNEALGAVN